MLTPMSAPSDVQHIEPNVDRIVVGTQEIILVGTAHVSRNSAELVERVIQESKPDVVAVELCESRFQAIRDPERWKNTDIVSVIRSGRAYVLLVQLLIAGFQRKLGSELHIKPGEEMVRAIEIAERVGARVALVDREVRITLKRTWASVGFWTSIKLIATILASVFSSKKIDEKEIERLKSADALEELMGEFSQKLPGVRNALIDERDQYLAEKIRRAAGSKVVAVLGAGHIPGVTAWLRKDVDIEKLEVIPPKSFSRNFFEWILPVAIVGMIVYGFFASGSGTSWEMIKAWVWITGFTAAVGAAVAFAHPITVVSSFVIAPFTSINPFLAVGWFSGLIEAMIRKPRVSDFETVTADIVTVKGMWTNRVTRILLVTALANLFASIGTIWGGWVLATML